MMNCKCLFTFFLAACSLTLSLQAVAEAQGKRVALVIGNGGYSRGPLKNPPADAALMGETLKDLGFEVMLHQDLDQKGMFRAIQSFGEALKGEDVEVGMFFYAGHGMQIKGRNYLIPVGAELNGEEDAEIEAVDVGRVLVKMEAAKVPLSVLVLDACRDNPFARSWRSGSSGLGLTQAPPSTLVAYATAPEQVAADGVGGNSPYTQALSKHLKEPGLEIGEVMRRVGAEVRELTEGKQVPWTAGSVTHAWYPSGACPAGQAFQGGRCVAQVECPPGATFQDGRCVAKVECPAGSVFTGGRCVMPVVTMAVPAKVEEPRGVVAAAVKPPAPVAAGEGTEGMVLLGAGPYLTLLPYDSERDEDKDHLLRYGELRRGALALPVKMSAFWMDVHEVTVNDYAACVSAGKCTSPYYSSADDDTYNFGARKRGDHPVNGVTWEQAQAYCGWRGKALPTEAQWEKALRGASGRAFPWGDGAADCGRAVLSEPREGCGREGTWPVGSRAAGASEEGIQDLVGNVSEWVSDRYQEEPTYSIGATDPTGPAKGKKRVVMGTNWRSSGEKMKLAREGLSPQEANERVGFRCVKAAAPSDAR